MVLYLENLCLTEKPRIFNPKPRVAPERYGLFVRTIRIMKNQSFMKYSFGNFLLLLLLSLQACAQTKDRIQTSETVVDTLYRPTPVFPIPNNVYKKYMSFRKTFVLSLYKELI